MPKPLTQIKTGASHIGFGTETLSLHPELAVLIAKTISAYSIADMQLAEIVAHALHAKAKGVVAMYTSVINATAKREMLLSAVKAGCKPEELKVVTKMLDAIAAAKNRRNDFAHHIWGESHDLPDALLLIDPITYATFAAAGIEARNLGQYTGSEFLERSEIMVYTRADLEESVAMSLSAAHLVSQVRYFIQEGGIEGAPMRYQRLIQLLGLPNPAPLSSGSGGEAPQQPPK